MLKSHNVDAVLLVAAWPVCHMSVGHVARVFESMGISTVCFFVKAFMHLIDQMKIPRAIVTNNFVGRTIGKPYDLPNQTNVVRQGIELLSSATINNSLKII